MEKLGGPPKPQLVLDKFQATLDDCDLFDLGFEGHQFTWWNGQSGRASVEERLDRVCASDEWLTIFPYAKMEHLDEDLLDHPPLLLYSRPERNR